MFGESYPDPVRVVSVGVPIDALLTGGAGHPNATTNSVEFCGGTHVQNSADIGDIVLVAEEAVKAGVRRLSVLTGPEATAAISYGYGGW